MTGNILPCLSQKLICPSNVTYKPQVPISSCTYIRQYVSIYTSSYEPNAINNVTRNTDIHVLHYWHMPLNKYACDTITITTTTLLLWSTYRPHDSVHTNPKDDNMQQVLHTLLPNMYQKQICPSSATYANYFYPQIRDNYIIIYTSYELTTINSVTRRTPIHNFTSLAYALNKSSCHILHVCPTAIIL